MMGLFKCLFYVGVGAGLFYSGMVYESHHNAQEMQDLKSQVRQMESIDYKVESVIFENSVNPGKVRGSLQRFEEKYLGGKNGS